MELDEEKITKLSSELFNALNRLHELAALTEDEFLSNPHYVASAKYFLIVAIEAAIDMCNHIISRNRLRVPEDYADTFRVMHEANFFEKVLQKNSREWRDSGTDLFTYTGQLMMK